jgi:hypothetical protein
VTDIISSRHFSVWVSQDLEILAFRHSLKEMSAFQHVVEDSCNARVGLMGNPSDGFKGKTLSFLLANFKATVRIEERSQEHGIEIAEPVFFDSLDHLFTHSQKIVSVEIRI